MAARYEHVVEGMITSVEVEGRMGPGGVEGVLVTVKRPVG